MKTYNYAFAVEIVRAGRREVEKYHRPKVNHALRRAWGAVRLGAASVIAYSIQPRKVPVMIFAKMAKKRAISMHIATSVHSSCVALKNFPDHLRLPNKFNEILEKKNDAAGAKPKVKRKTAK